MVTLNQIFRSDMIVQANKPVRVFGEGEGLVKVKFAGFEKQTQAKGKWVLEFPSMPYGGPYEIEAEFDGEKKTYWKYICRGRVFACRAIEYAN